MHRGDVWDAELSGSGAHPVVVVTRDTAIPVLRSVVCATISSTIRGHRAELEVNSDEGLDHPSAVNCDNLVTLTKAQLTRRRGALGPTRLRMLDDALRLALDL
jgi:mRNA interferase MazF